MTERHCTGLFEAVTLRHFLFKRDIYWMQYLSSENICSRRKVVRQIRFQTNRYEHAGDTLPYPMQ